MQRNEMGGVGVQHVAWDEDFLEKAFAQAWQCIQVVTAHHKTPWPDSVRLPIHCRLMSRFPGGLSPKNTAKLDMDPV